MKILAALLGLAGIVGVVAPAAAEIVFLEGGEVVSADATYAYQHPSLPSVVFVSPETRQMAILPPPVVFLPTPPLLWRAPTAMPVYPPVAAAGFNAPARPSNRDVTTYNLQRAHSFGQKLYYQNGYLSLGTTTAPYVYGYGYGYGALGVPYPPPQPAGFNQPARPSNRDNASYILERAHRFSMDQYK